MDPTTFRNPHVDTEQCSTMGEPLPGLISPGPLHIGGMIHDEIRLEPSSPIGSGMPLAVPHVQALQREVFTQNWNIHRRGGHVDLQESGAPWFSSETASNYSTASISSSFNSSITQGYLAQTTGQPAADQNPDPQRPLDQRHGEPTLANVDIARPYDDPTTSTHKRRRPSGRDEFDGPVQFLQRPNNFGIEPREADLPILPTTLLAREQDEILGLVNDRLSQCAFDFVARYQFPIPVEPEKRPVQVPGDREWSEWVFLLKRLATKRRIPARLLYNRQIKQLITVLENSLEMRHAAKHQSRPLKDDRNVLQLVSSGIQVAKILKDAPAMQNLDELYLRVENVIARRRIALQPAITAA